MTTLLISQTPDLLEVFQAAGFQATRVDQDALAEGGLFASTLDQGIADQVRKLCADKCRHFLSRNEVSNGENGISWLEITNMFETNLQLVWNYLSNETPEHVIFHGPLRDDISTILYSYCQVMKIKTLVINPSGFGDQFWAASSFSDIGVDGFQSPSSGVITLDPKASLTNAESNQISFILTGEATLSNQYQDQLAAVEVLARRLPTGVHINVYAEPALTSSESLRSRLGNIPNLSLKDSQHGALDWCDGAGAVALVSGNAGWQAIQGGKPVILFGEDWYRDLPGVFEWRLEDDGLVDRVISFSYNSDELERALRQKAELLWQGGADLESSLTTINQLLS